MADKEIPDLTSGTAVAAGDLVHVVRGVNSRKVPLGVAAGKSIPEVLAGLVIRQQVFTASGTYTPHASMVYCTIEGVGGGGGGGGAQQAAVNLINGAGGGGGGEYSRVYASKADVGASKPVTIGAAGNGGAAGNNNGAAGGTTSVGTLMTAFGGGGGNGCASNLNGDGGAGGNGGTGGQLRGGDGWNGQIQAGLNNNGSIYTTRGGDSAWGRGARQGGAAANGQPGSGFGSGGGGASDFNNQTNRAGGNGTPGKVIITEFCSA
jgi:hypothetical protein